MSRGRFATRTRMTFSIACSPSGQGRSTNWTLRKCPFFSWLGKGSKSVYPERRGYVGPGTNRNLVNTKDDPVRWYLLEVTVASRGGVLQHTLRRAIQHPYNFEKTVKGLLHMDEL